MATKDRLGELQASLVAEDVSAKPKNMKKEKELRRTFEVTEILTQWINSIEENTAICESILNSLANVNSSQQQDKLLSTFKNSETVSYNIASKLKSYHEVLNTVKPEERTADYRMKYVQYTSLNARFKDALERHQNCVQKHRDVRKEILRKCNAIVNGDQMDDDELENILDSKKCQMFIHDYLQQEREAREQLTDIEARHKELLTIESHLAEIRDLFTKLAVLVVEQQESINRVEYHALNANEYLENTVTDLQKAKKKKKKVRKWTIIGIVFVVFLSLILILNFIL